MKKLLFIIGITMALMSCQQEEINRQEVEPDPIDTYAECLGVPEANASDFTINPEGLIRGHIIPDKQNKSVAVVDKIWPKVNGVPTINVVLSEDWYKLDSRQEENYVRNFLLEFNDFYETMGIAVDVYVSEEIYDRYELDNPDLIVYEGDNTPENYVFWQHAFFSSTSIGMQGGKQYASSGPNDVLERRPVIQHTLGHIEGLEDQDARGDRDDWITIDFTNVTEGVGFFEINPDATFCGDYDYESLMQTQSQQATYPVVFDAVTDKEGNDIPTITDWSAGDIEFTHALYGIE